MVKITMEGAVKRVYSEERGGYTSHYLVITEPSNNKAGENVIRFRSREELNAAEGDRVKVDAFVDGREWDGAKGLMYFTDLNISHVEVLESAKTADDGETVVKATLQDALKAFIEHGGNKADFALFCERATGKKPDRKFGCEYWTAVIAAAANPDPVADDAADDDLPF